MLATILVCSALTAPTAGDCTSAKARDRLVVKLETANPVTCFLQAQAYLGETSIGRGVGRDDVVRIMCR